MSVGSSRDEFAQGLPIAVDEVESAQPVFGAQPVGAASECGGVLVCRLFDLIPVKQVVVHDTDRQMVTAAGTSMSRFSSRQPIPSVSSRLPSGRASILWKRA